MACIKYAENKNAYFLTTSTFWKKNSTVELLIRVHAQTQFLIILTQECSQTFRSPHTLNFSSNERFPIIENSSLYAFFMRFFLRFFTQNVKNSQELLMAFKWDISFWSCILYQVCINNFVWKSYNKSLILSFQNKSSFCLEKLTPNYRVYQGQHWADSATHWRKSPFKLLGT
jgi:hypothetical protein